MASTIASLAVALAVTTAGGLFGPKEQASYPPPPGPGYGWGFPNGNPDGYGFVDYGTTHPIGADRTSEYFFQRHMAVAPEHLVFPTYYNPYITRGQRYLPFANCGGFHPAGGPPMGSAMTPEHPYVDSLGTGPRVPVPTFSGEVEARPVNPGGSGLTP